MYNNVFFMNGIELFWCVVWGKSVDNKDQIDNNAANYMGKIVESYGDIRQMQREAGSAIVCSMRKAGHGLPRTGILFAVHKDVRDKLGPAVMDVALGRLIDSGRVWTRRFRREENEPIVYYLRRDLKNG